MPTLLRYDYYNPVQVRFGVNRLDDLSQIVGPKQVLLVTTPGTTNRGLTRKIFRLLKAKNLIIWDDVRPNPELPAIEECSANLARERPEIIVAVGGGSAIDTAKALSVTLAVAGEGFSLRAHFEAHAPLPPRALKIVAVPTTAGSGSEVTPFATIWDRRAEEKYSLDSPKIYPWAALLDPTLTTSLSKRLTIISGLDALSHAFESLWNRNANPIVSVWAQRAITIIFAVLPGVLRNPDNLAGRSRMLEASLLSGLAISQTKTALAHSISYPLTVRFGVPHGLASSFTLPALLQFNAAEDKGLFLGLAKGLGCGGILELRNRLDTLFRQLEVLKLLAEYGLTLDSLLALRPYMLKPGRANNNRRAANLDDLAEILSDSSEYFFPR